MKCRIKGHRAVRAGDLVPHELNPRTHSTQQKKALQALYDDIGFARSLLAYELPDGRLKLIDGHLRQSMDPEAEVTVEVLDVNDDEARKLLLSIDPLAQLAGYDSERVQQIIAEVSTPSQALSDLWDTIGKSNEAVSKTLSAAGKDQAKDHSGGKGQAAQTVPEQFLVIVTCPDEKEQVKLLRKLRKEGLSVAAKTV